jgi:NAD(P)-dependent dehydrogenase (short-subunit alcohol dehydrogenase family)
MGRLDGKRALITGGSNGIGLATARAFVREGARVVITGRHAARLHEAQRALGHGTRGVVGDVGNLEDLDRLVDTVAMELGGLDILFANAGLVAATPLGTTTEAAFDRIMNVNVKGLFFTVQKSLSLLRPGASVVLNGSVAPNAGSPHSAVYAASKAAVRTFARNFSAMLVPRGIRVNVVSPGPIAVRRAHPPGHDHAVATVPTPAPPGPVNPWLLSIPRGRFGTPDEVAHAVVFLASDESRFIVGSEIVVDGGRSQLPDGAMVYRALATRSLL